MKRSSNLLNIKASLVANIGFNATTIKGSFGNTTQITMWPQMALHRNGYTYQHSFIPYPFQIDIGFKLTWEKFCVDGFFCSVPYYGAFEWDGFRMWAYHLYAGGVLSKLCQLPFCRPDWSRRHLIDYSSFHVASNLSLALKLQIQVADLCADVLTGTNSCSALLRS